MDPKLQPLAPGVYTGRKIREYMNAILALALSNRIRTDPSSGLNSEIVGDFTALWIRSREGIAARITAVGTSGRYSWIAQVAIPASPWWTDDVNSSGTWDGSDGKPPDPAVQMNVSDPPYTVGMVVPAMRHPQTNVLVIMVGF
jgi:hypothetical protein